MLPPKADIVTKSRSLPYVAPFAVFIAFLTLNSFYRLPDLADQIVRIAIIGAVLLLFSRGVISLRAPHWPVSLLLGVAVFALWIAPDLLFPGYRQHWLFQNALTGSTHPALSAAAQASPAILILRALRAFIIVPIVEELFWRAWLMRWLINSDFEKIPLGRYVPAAFWVTAVLFASEHGSYWDVGLAAGVIYNFWMVRSKSLGDVILAHAVTNLCLSIYVVAAGKWEYWL